MNRWRRLRRRKPVTTDTLATELPRDWQVDGPHFKDANHYLSKDGTNPEAPWPGYGWPLGTECWYYVLEGRGWYLHATGSTPDRAAARALRIATSKEPGRESGAVSSGSGRRSR